MNRKTIMRVSGVLIVLGISVLLVPLILVSYSSYMSHTLREQAKSRYQEGYSLSHEKMARSLINSKKLAGDEEYSPLTGLYPEPAPKLMTQTEKGEIIGKLSIPSLDISEAILQGTGQSELAKAPGHLPDSVFPGQIGTSIIAGHNATTFRHLDQITEGTEFTITTKQGVFTFSVTGQRILHVSDILLNMAYPAIALETCYPLDALYLTDRRLFVEAALVKSELNTELNTSKSVTQDVGRNLVKNGVGKIDD